MKCPYCGKKVESDYLFCPSCGKKIEQNSNETKKEMEEKGYTALLIIAGLMLFGLITNNIFIVFPIFLLIVVLSIMS